MPTRPNITVTVRDRVADLKLGLARLNGDRVLVGIPAAEAPRTGKQPINNAQLLYVFTNGSAARGQVGRPVIEPALQQRENRARLVSVLRQAAESEMDGDHAGALQLLGKAGLLGSNFAKRWFTDPRNGWAPNRPSTVRRKLAKLRGTAKKQYDALVAAGGDPATLVTPGIDTAQMRRAITYVVRG